MNIDTIKNKLIMYKNYNNLDRSLVQEIQSALMKKTKLSDFEELLNKVDKALKANESKIINKV